MYGTKSVHGCFAKGYFAIITFKIHMYAQNNDIAPYSIYTQGGILVNR